MTTTSVDRHPRDRHAPTGCRTYGLVGAVASLDRRRARRGAHRLGPEVAEDRFSYPFDATWFTTWQVVFAVQHAAMLPLFVGLLILERRHPSRALRIGTWIALVGQVLLDRHGAGRDLRRARTARDRARRRGRRPVRRADDRCWASALVVAGVGASRRGSLQRAGSWLLLGLGVYVFVVLFPAVFGPMVAGRIAIGVWLLGFAALGLAIRRVAR